VSPAIRLGSSCSGMSSSGEHRAGSGVKVGEGTGVGVGMIVTVGVRVRAGLGGRMAGAWDGERTGLTVAPAALQAERVINNPQIAHRHKKLFVVQAHFFNCAGPFIDSNPAFYCLEGI